MNTWRITATVIAAVIVAAAAHAADKKKPAGKTPSPAPRNKVGTLVEKAQRPSMSGIVSVTKDQRGFAKAKLTADDGQVYVIVNPGSVEELDGQKVKIICGDLKKDSKTKAEPLRVEEVQKLVR